MSWLEKTTCHPASTHQPNIEKRTLVSLRKTDQSQSVSRQICQSANPRNLDNDTRLNPRLRCHTGSVLSISSLPSNQTSQKPAIMGLRDRVFSFRDRFRGLDRKWHVLIGAQLLFGMVIFRSNRSKQKERMIEEQKNVNSK